MKKRRLHRLKIQITQIVIFVSCLLSLVSLGVAEDRFFEIKAKKFSYTPHIIKVNKGDLVKIRLISEDVTHGLFIDGYGLNTSAHPGEEGNITFIARKTGRFSFRCSVTCGEFHPYMIGYLIVEPNSRFLMYVLLIILAGAGSIVIMALSKKKDTVVNEQR